MPLGAEPEQLDSQQWPGAQVKGSSRFLADQRHRFGFAFCKTQGAEVCQRQLKACERMDDLHRLAVNDRESSAQDLVATDNLPQSQLQRRAVERAAESDGCRTVE